MTLSTVARSLILAPLVCVARLAAQSPDAAAPRVDCSQVTAASNVTLPATIPIAVKNNHVHIDVCLRGVPHDFVLDTGAPMSILDMSLAKSAGLAITNPYQARGAGAGSIAAGSIRGVEAVIPGSRIAIPVGTTMDFSVMSAASGAKLEGIVGAEFMRRYVTEIDYRNDIMRLHDPSTFAYRGAGTVLPITFQGPYINVRATIGLADDTSAEVRLLVDAGSSLALALSTPFVEANGIRERIGPSVTRPGGRGVGGMTMADVGRVAYLQLGNIRIERPVTNLPRGNAGALSNAALGDGNLGAEVLRRFVVYFDYSRRQMILEPHEDTGEPFETDMSGLTLIAPLKGTGLLVDFVVLTSAASGAGVRAGDLVTAIDGAPATGSMLEALRRRFRREGERVQLEIERDGQRSTVRFVTKRII